MTPADHAAAIGITRLMISYPVVFDRSPTGALYLPKDLTEQEAERVKDMIDTLVMKP